ncbi:hypothetical protein HJC23_008660 [Cyclotella cryptica]|uniref:Uncharacterized protein n=1 Tax=Cyclotella cryptica TaxID=29204 RepID=A0ABD3QGG4_9STRA|eukprot:CCRYP_005374-RA/>CCRYP_005374-RA protein AED:0.04 eAED:-0.03 QI:0/-1/0/1/-1/1/1/0/1092
MPKKSSRPPSSPQSRPRSRRQPEQNEDYKNNSSQKSITSGISTLFRRQPSPEPSQNRDLAYPGPAYAAPSSVRAADGSTRASSRSATHSAVTKRASGKMRKKLSRKTPPPPTIPSISYSATDESGSFPSADESEFTSGSGDEGTSTSESESEQQHGPRRSARRGTGDDKKIRLPRRYRGFSTSISSLFLDESIVCGAMACCGLLLSSRTEYLLNERNVKRGLTRRGTKSGGSRAPSRILGISLLVTILCVMATYVIWGFTEGLDVRAGGLEYGVDDASYNYEYDGDDAANANAADDDKANAGDDGNANAADDAAQAADDGNAAGDDGVYVQNANDDVAQAADDGNANAGDDGAVASDDGAAAQQDDAAAAQDDGAANAKWDDFYGMQDDAVNRKLSSPSESEDVSPSSTKHNFNGIMKLRDYREHIVEPVFETASAAYTNILTQFSADEFTPPSRHHTRYLAEDTTEDDIGSQARALIIVIFLFMLGVVGRRRRMRTRFAILRSRAQDDHLYYASILTNPSGSLATPEGTLMENFHEREDKYDGACSHTLFGCYPVDSQSPNYADYGDQHDDENATVDTGVKKRKGGDFMHRTMTTLLNCCCGCLCKCWCQVFSICALAQEARETRLLLPPKMQRIDLITHQPFHEYAKDVNNVRRRYMERASRTWFQHWAALSHLSRYIMLAFVLTVILVTATLLLHPRGSFTWMDAVVLMATFGQSFLVLMIVFGIFHRSDLSFDAVVKFFAVGFVICVPVGFAIEGLLINGLVWMLYLVYYPVRWAAGEDFDQWIIDNHRLLWVLAELVNAYFVAALVEELCKYYGFRFLEHPDLIFLTGLDRTATQAQNQGGLDAYKYDSQLVSEFSRSQDSECGSADSRDTRRKSKEKMNSSLKHTDDDEEEEPELRTLRQQAAAITTGMISVAVGLACAENFLYVFFLGGAGGSASISQEFAVLIFRSIFPVHVLAAAMQSINMIKKFIEEKDGSDHNVGVGRIVLPAVLLHGTFDAILMVINAYVESRWDEFYEENDDYEEGFVPYNALLLNVIAWVSIIGVMVFSFGWYSYQNQVQNIRLMKIEQKNRPRSKRGSFKSPDLDVV